MATIKDSGERTQFETGAVRDMHEGKGDMASIPWEAVLRLSRHYENGAKKPCPAGTEQWFAVRRGEGASCGLHQSAGWALREKTNFSRRW